MPGPCAPPVPSLAAQAAAFSADALSLDCAAEIARLEACIRDHTARTLRKRGLVVGVSGGIDSAVCAVLAARALGPSRVRAVLLPERESSPESLRKGRLVCAAAGVAPVVEDISTALDALGCYAKRDAVLASLVPEYRPNDRFKIVLAEPHHADRVPYFNLVVELSSRAGEIRTVRMPVDAYLAIVAATNLKQRIRTTVLSTHADALNAAVLGTPNRLEYDLGFFVRGGDGLADLKPIAHLYKTQVYALARHLALPPDVVNQTPSTDTYSLPQTQEEFYYTLPYAQMDLVLCAYHRSVPPEAAAPVVGLSVERTRAAYRDIAGKIAVAQRLSADAVLCSPTDGSPSA